VDRQVVLITGAPGAGKSTLASRLAPALQMPLLAKDVIKESLWDALAPPPGDLSWSRRLGGAAMEVLWQLAMYSPRVILEANFRPHSPSEQAKLRALSARVVEVYCWCPPEEAIRRYATRAATGSHHPAHVTSTLDPTLLAEFDQPMGAGSLIRVNTTLTIDIKPLVRSIMGILDNSTPRDSAS